MGLGTFRRHRQRRYRGQKARQAAREGRTAAAMAFEAKRRASPGTPLPAGFINARVYEALIHAKPVPYDTYEDLLGATEQELVQIPGIGASTARKIIAAVKEWAAQQAPGAPEAGGDEGDGSGTPGEAGDEPQGPAEGSGDAGGDDGSE